MRLVLLLCVFFCSSLTTYYSQNFTSRHFTAENGLPDLYVYNSFQDNKGYLWSSTTKGLVRFDGQKFVDFSPKLNEGDFIYTGAIDSNGLLWFGSFSGKIFTYQAEADSLSSYSSAISGSVDRILPSADNKNIYFISKGSGIFWLNESKLIKMPFSQIYQVNSVVEMAPGLLVLATPEGLYAADIKAQSVKKIKGCDVDVSQIQKLKGKNKLLIAQNGNSLSEGSLTANYDSVLCKPFFSEFDFSNKGINRFLYAELNDYLCLVTNDEHFYIIDLNTNKSIEFAEDKYQATANSILIDRDQNIWVSTAGKGLFRFYKEAYGFISFNNASIHCITKDKNNSYFGTDNGIEVVAKAGLPLKKIIKAGSTLLGKVTALYFDDEKLWIGTEGKGLFIMDPVTQLTTKPELGMVANISVNAITGNKNKKEVYVGTNLDGAFIYSNYKLLNHFSVQNSLLHNNVYFATGCSNNHIYYATHNTAINFSKNNQVYEINLGQGLISDFNSFAESKDGSLAIGTNGDGVYFLKDTSITTMFHNNLLESKFCNSLAYDANGHLWVATRYSLYKFYPQEKILKKMAFGNDNSMLFNQNSFYVDANGELMFGTNRNVLVYKENNEAENLPKVSILNVTLYDTLQIKKQTDFKNGKYDITFEFSALYLKNSEDVTFSYILEGRDSKWSEPSSTRIAAYFGLNEGSYTFKVRAYNGSGFTGNDVASFTFKIDKPFWKKTWFWFMVIAALTVIISLIVRLRTATLLRAKLRLERLVDNKTEELRMEKELVEAKNEIIEEQNKDITSSITYAKRIQEALLPDKNLDEQIKSKILIYYRPKDIVSGDFYWISEKDNRFLFAACDCTGHGVPGAFMSMIGTTLLNKIVYDNNESQTDKIISELDKEILKSLHQKNNSVTDGMEAALCSIDFETSKVEFTGAKRPLYLFRKQTNDYNLEEFKADKYPIGGFAEILDKTFTLNQIQAAKGDMIYMFSDGLIDQFGGANIRRIGSTRVRELLANVVKLPLEEQWKQIDDYINSWKGTTKQTDDILILGIKL